MTGGIPDKGFQIDADRIALSVKQIDARRKSANQTLIIRDWAQIINLETRLSILSEKNIQMCFVGTPKLVVSMPISVLNFSLKISHRSRFLKMTTNDP